MNWKHAVSRRGAIGLLSLGLLVPSAAMAQTGHQPLPATPDAASPVASPVASSAGTWQVESVAVVDIEGSPVAISPDGQWLAGVGPNRTLCVWDVASLASTCDSTELPIDEDSIIWSPDSTAVAFTENVFTFMEEGDIHVFELETGESVNLTDDGFEGGLLDFQDEESVPFDTVPTWRADSQSLLFSRSDMGGDKDVVPTELMSISRQGGEPEHVHTLYADGPFGVYTTMFELADGSLVYAVNPSDVSDPQSGIWVLSADGDATQVMPSTGDGDFPGAVITDVNDASGTRLAVGYSAYRVGAMETGGGPLAFVLDLDTGEVTPIESPEAEIGQVPAFPALSPDGGTVLAPFVGPVEGDQVFLQGADPQIVDLGPGNTATNVGRGVTRGKPQWTDSGIVFIPRGMLADPYLLTMSQG